MSKIPDLAEKVGELKNWTELIKSKMGILQIEVFGKKVKTYGTKKS